jgi:enoyl-CoA hydratase
MAYSTIEIEREDSHATLVISRPKALNALNRATREELAAAIGELGTDDDIRSIIITGSGTRAFSAGADIAELAALEGAEAGAAQARHMIDILRQMNELPKPIIIAVNGYALGGGCELALAGDIVLASENAQFGLPEVGLGIIPGFGGTQRLPRQIGRTRALELILTGARISASQAAEWGLVNKVVPLEELMPTAHDIAGTIAEKSPLAIALAKRAVYKGLDTSLGAGTALESALFGEAVGSEDRREGTRAFLEKRAPEWRAK